MALLRLSTDTQCVGTQKDKMDGSVQNPIYVNVPLYILIMPTLPIFYKVIKDNSRLFPLKSVNHYRVLTLKPVNR